MLDFYLIEDKQPAPDYPELLDLKYVGGLSYKTFCRLSRKGIIEERYNYFSDFRWSKEAVEHLCEICSSHHSDEDVKKLLAILKNTLELKYGLIAYCD